LFQWSRGRDQGRSESEREFPDIENVYIFVSDACRYVIDSKRLTSYGTPIRTVAASTFTAPSFSDTAEVGHPECSGEAVDKLRALGEMELTAPVRAQVHLTENG
jgi:hypothetical protein